MRFLNLMFKNLMKSNMAKPEVHNLPTQFSENFRLFRDVYFSVYYIFIYFFLLFINVFSFLNGLEAIGSFIAFLSSKVCTKNISRALTEWANQSLFLSKASDSFNPLSLNSDQHQFSPNNIHRLSSATSMRINQMITKRKISDLLSISPN